MLVAQEQCFAIIAICAGASPSDKPRADYNIIVPSFTDIGDGVRLVG